MNLTLQTLSNYLEDFLNISQITDYCPNGIQVEGKESIAKIGVAVSASLATIETAVKLGLDALIVHHGIFWNRDTFVISGSKREKLRLLLESGISLLAYHLPLDMHQEVGNNWRAAKDLGWGDLLPFGNIGVKGSFPEIGIEDFVTHLEAYYKSRAHVALGGKAKVRSAALISGGAYKETVNAAQEGVDCFITGSFDEPAWSSAHEEKINFLALGHTATEKVGPKALGVYLEKKFGIPTVFIDSDNPF